MPHTHHVVVDGSNLATEGRTIPSLAQLDEAVRAYLLEDPDATIIVVVDATFAHRIDASERDRFEQAELHGELVSPPAGAIGRGDAFVLRIAERTGAVVLSNDSFQEFHGEHPWLFEPGRLVGGKPIAGVGWIFTPRLPVRGVKSRKATKESREDSAEELTAPRKAAEVVKALLKAERATKASPKAKAATKKAPAAEKSGRKKKAEEPSEAPKKAGRARAGAPADSPVEVAASGARRTKKAAVPTGAPVVAKASPRAKKALTAEPSAETVARPKSAKAKTAPAAAGTSKRAPKKAAPTAERQPRVRRAIDEATAEVLSPPPTKQKRERAKPTEPPPAVNDPLAFIRFVAHHPLGSALEGVVVSFTSHGAMVDVALPDTGVLHCYIPLRALGDPAPRKAREVLSRGERRQFVLASLDPPRRMAELSLDGVAVKEPAADAAPRKRATAARPPRSR